MGVEIWKHRAFCYTSWLLAHLWSCSKAFRRRKPQRWACRVARVLSVVWFRLIQDLDTSLVVFLRGACSGLGPPEGGIVYGLFSKEALYVGKASVSRTRSPDLAARLTEHFRCLYRSGLKDANKPRYRLLMRELWSVRFFPLAVFPTISQTLAAEALAISMEAPMGNARDAAEQRRIWRKGENVKVRAPRRRPSSWRRRKRRPWEMYLGLLRYPRSSGEPVPGQASSVSRCAGAGHSFFSSLHSTDTGRACVLWFSRSSLSAVRMVRIHRTSRGSSCRGGLGGKLHHICIMRANMFPNFSQCSASRVLDYLLRFHSLPPKRVPVYQVPSVVENIGNVKRKFHDVIGRVRCGPACRWTQTQLAVRKAGSKRWLRFFNGKRALRDVRSEDFRDWEVEQFADALALRSLRAAPGVWRPPVWGQADEINSECLSLFFGRGQSKREFHKELIHNFMEPCAVNWILFIKLGRRHRSGQSWKCRLRRPCAKVMSSLRTIVRPTMRGTWIGKNLVPHVTTVSRQAHLNSPAWASRTGCLHSSSH